MISWAGAATGPGGPRCRRSTRPWPWIWREPGRPAATPHRGQCAGRACSTSRRQKLTAERIRMKPLPSRASLARVCPGPRRGGASLLCALLLLVSAPPPRLPTTSRSPPVHFLADDGHAAARRHGVGRRSAGAASGWGRGNTGLGPRGVATLGVARTFGAAGLNMLVNGAAGAISLETGIIIGSAYNALGIATAEEW